MSEIKISLTNSQADFVELVYSRGDFDDDLLFVGGPGCGKSYLIGFVATWLVQHSKHANIYIYAPENHHIRTIEVPNVLYWLDKFGLKNNGYNSHENMIKIDSDKCGNIYFKPMDNPGTFVGYQSYAALFDELDTLGEAKAEEVYKKAGERNRQQPEDVPDELRRTEEETGRRVSINKMLVFTTPEGYNFCYKKWELDPEPTFKQVKGKTSENPTVTRSYLKRIRESYPAHIAEAYLNGEFVNMQSLSVYYNYDAKLHDSEESIQPGENLYIGCDFNVENTTAIVFVKRNGGKEWHAVDEMTGVRDAHTLACLIHDRYQSKGHHITMYPDSTGGNRSNANSASKSAIAELEAKGFTVRAFSKNKNAPVDDRIAAVNNGFLKSLVFVNQRLCPGASRCLINQAFGKDGKPDKKSGYDHSNDGFGYPLVYELGLRPRLFKIDYSFAQKRII